MRKRIAGLLLPLLLLCLCACRNQEDALLDALDRNQADCAALEASLEEVQAALTEKDADLAAMKEELNAVKEEIEYLSTPPLLTENRTISYLGDPVVVYSDGETDYLRLDDLEDVPAGLEQREDKRTLYVPFDDLVTALGYVRGRAPDGTGYVAKEIEISPVTPGVDVPVLMYHAVSDSCWGLEELFVSPEAMEAQLQYLTENGYDPIWFEDLSHLEDYDKPVLLTFDDGYDDNYTELFPLLEEYNVKATIFVIGSAMGSNHKMTAGQVRELSRSGLVSIQSHTLTHRKLGTLTEAQQQAELKNSKDAIAAVTGEVPYVLCYPEGSYNEQTLALAPRYYAYGLKMNGDLYTTDHSAYEINRFYVSRYTTLDQFAAFCGYAE